MSEFYFWVPLLKKKSGNVGDWTEAPTHTRQVLYQWNHILQALHAFCPYACPFRLPVLQLLKLILSRTPTTCTLLNPKVNSQSSPFLTTSSITAAPSRVQFFHLPPRTPLPLPSIRRWNLVPKQRDWHLKRLARGNQGHYLGVSLGEVRNYRLGNGGVWNTRAEGEWTQTTQTLFCTDTHFSEPFSLSLVQPKLAAHLPSHSLPLSPFTPPWGPPLLLQYLEPQDFIFSGFPDFFSPLFLLDQI